MTFERWMIVASFAVNVIWFIYAMVNTRHLRRHLAESERKLDEALGVSRESDKSVAEETPEVVKHLVPPWSATCKNCGRLGITHYQRSGEHIDTLFCRPHDSPELFEPEEP